MKDGGIGRKDLVVTCPACDTPIHFRKKPGYGRMIVCRKCDSLLQVLNVSPLELDWAFEVPMGNFITRHNGAESGSEPWDHNEYDEFDAFSPDGGEYRGDSIHRRYG